MNILLVKTDTIRFGSCRPKEIPFGACDAAAILFRSAALLHPEHNFYMYGSNDISQSNCPPNLIDIETSTKSIANELGIAKYKAGIKYAEDNNLKFDRCIVWYGPSVPLVQYEDGYLSNKGTPKILLESQKSMCTGLAVATHFNVPTYFVINDPRQINTLPADINRPAMIISQMNGYDHSKVYLDKSTRAEVNPPYEVTYRPIEKLWLLSKNKVDWRNFKKPNRFIFAVNGNIHKLDYVKKWILNYLPNEVIYGKWNHDKSLWNKIESLGLISNFVESPMTQMEDKMFASRYTLVIPPSHKLSNFVSQKVFSMMYYGIIPFWCTNDYDSDNLYSYLPDYLKINSPEEFYRKVDELDRNENLYSLLLNKLYDLLEDKYFTTDFVNELIGDIL